MPIISVKDKKIIDEGATQKQKKTKKKTRRGRSYSERERDERLC